MIQFYFDPISPYAWLASSQIARIESVTGQQVEFVPILFAGLLKAHGHKGPAEIPAKRDYTFKDVLRRASAYGLTVEGPPSHPFNPLLALRACVAVDDLEMRKRFAIELMNQCWSKGLDITEASSVASIAKACQLEVDGIEIDVVSLASQSDIKQGLIANTENAIANGFFGVPVFYVDGEQFWGDDRIDTLLRFIAGDKHNDEQLAKMLARPSGI